MNERTGRAVEIGATILVAAALLVGGRQLLGRLQAFPAVSTLALLVIGGVQVASVRRRMGGPGGHARLLVTRDLTYLAGVALALAVVVFRAHWAIQSCIVATEFALVLDIVGRLATPLRPGGPEALMKPQE